MKISSLVSLTIAFSLLAIPLSSQATSWTCKNGSNVREINIQSGSPSSPVLCSVIYKKATEGVADQTLWTATNDVGYCEEKAKTFVDKLNSLGWACQEAAAAGSATSAASAASATTKPGN